MRCGGASREQNAESLPPAERMRAEQAAPGEPAACWGAGAQRGASRSPAAVNSDFYQV